MDYLFRGEYGRFREEVRDFLKAHLSPEMAARNAGVAHPTREDMLQWTRICYRKGWSAPGWPKEYGGPGWTPTQRFIWDEECCLAGAPRPHMQNLDLVAPVVFTFGTEAQKKKYLPPILKGEVLWAQGFSEPNAGSDLAALRTTAVREGGEYVINGQKIWTSAAHYADMLFLVVRTDSSVRAQLGISFIVVSTTAPGVTIRPIVSISGRHHFNETFFDNVRVPLENLIGEENKGWTYAKFLLGRERFGAADLPRNKFYLRHLKDIARKETFAGRPLIEHPHFSAQIAQQEIDLLAHEASALRVLKCEENGTPVDSALTSVLKIRGADIQKRTTELLVEACGLYGAPFYPQKEHVAAGVPPLEVGPSYAAPLASDFLLQRATSIFGGTHEIQRNLLSRALLRQTVGETSQLLSLDQRQLKDSVQRFVAERYEFQARRKHLLQGLEAQKSCWRQFVEMGWIAAGLPEEVGGLGGSFAENAIILEELGRGMVIEPYLAAAVHAAQAIDAGADGRWRKELLAGLLEGKEIVVLAHAEARARGTLEYVQTTATERGGRYVLNGEKAVVLGAPLAERLIVSARIGTAAQKRLGWSDAVATNNIALFVVDARSPGVTLKPYRLIDGRSAADVLLEDVRVELAAMLGDPGRALGALRRANHCATVGSCAEAVGAMQSAFLLTRDYLNTRKQFGKTLSEFQALQHRLADMFVDLEQARSITNRAVEAVTGDDPALQERAVRAAKARVAQSGRFVCGQAIQLHGGMGMTEEYAAGHYYKWTVAFDILFGNSALQIEQYARDL